MYGGYVATSKAAAFNKGIEKNVLNDYELYKQAGGNFSLEEADALRDRAHFETESVITQYHLIHNFNYFDL